MTARELNKKLADGGVRFYGEVVPDGGETMNRDRLLQTEEVGPGTWRRLTAVRRLVRALAEEVAELSNDQSEEYRNFLSRLSEAGGWADEAIHAHDAARGTEDE